MEFQHDDARLRVPRKIAEQLQEAAKNRKITGRYAWGILARKVLLEFLEKEEGKK